MRASQGRQWFRPVIDVECGILAWLRGEFDSARSYFEQGTTDLSAADCDRIDAVWFVPSDAIATAHVHLAWARMVHGDLTVPRPRCRLQHAAPKNSASPKVRTCTPTRSSWRAGSASKPVISTGPRY